MRAEASTPGGGPAASLLRVAAALGLLAAAFAPARAQDDAAQCSHAQPQITVTIENLRSERGEVVVELYPDDPSRFLASHGRLARVRRKAERGMTVCIPAPAPGAYAVAVYHDENDDGRFNRNGLGLPSEGFGLSNNPSTFLGKPPLKSVRFHVTGGDNAIQVRLRYLAAAAAP
jgi:uncharacterized protein (DUF2141 family)